MWELDSVIVMTFCGLFEILGVKSGRRVVMTNKIAKETVAVWQKRDHAFFIYLSSRYSKIKNKIGFHYNCSMDYISFIWFLADFKEFSIDKRAFFTLNSPLNFFIGPL